VIFNFFYNLIDKKTPRQFGEDTEGGNIRFYYFEIILSGVIDNDSFLQKGRELTGYF
jgi:hypothetical protein